MIQFDDEWTLGGGQTQPLKHPLKIKINGAHHEIEFEEGNKVWLNIKNS